MPQAEVIDFTAYAFTDEEYAEAVCYSDMQLRHIQTELARYAQQKVSDSVLNYPSAEMYVRSQEYLRGLMDSMRYLIELHHTHRGLFENLVADRMQRQKREASTLETAIVEHEEDTTL